MTTQLVPLRRCFVPPHTLTLDNYPSVDPKNKDPNSSSATTADVTPPRFAHKVLYTDWTAVCKAFMGLGPLQPMFNMPQNGLTNEYLYLKDEALHHASEADVVRTAALYVLHPINKAFNAHPYFAGTVTCRSEASLKSNGLRADVTYFKNPTGQVAGATQRAYAVIEFKKRHLIDVAQFEYAERVNSSHNEQDVRRQAPAICIQAGGTSGQGTTFYKRYSCKLMKQAAAYAIGQRTKYVALFDWDTLVLVRFQDMNLLDSVGNLKDEDDMMKDGVGEWCQTTIITNSGHMRPALMGFLAEAYDQTPF